MRNRIGGCSCLAACTASASTPQQLLCMVRAATQLMHDASSRMAFIVIVTIVDHCHCHYCCYAYHMQGGYTGGMLASIKAVSHHSKQHKCCQIFICLL